MRIVVVGGSGLIGDKVMTALHDAGHKPVAASPAFGTDAYTGEGLDEAMSGANVVVDVSNAPAWEDEKELIRKRWGGVHDRALDPVHAVLGARRRRRNRG